MKIPPLSGLLGATRFDTDSVTHIDASRLVPGSPAARAVIAVCPAGVYREQGDRVVADDAACLAVAPETLSWHYPRGGFGVRFREG